jgi:predicted kinase
MEETESGLSLTLVGGFAGSGKSEFARFLSSVTNWALLDKDTLSRPIVEQLLVALGGERDDRQSELYQQQVRPHEYRCLMDTALENLSSGVSTVLAAPFLRELSDEWLTRLRNNARSKNATLSVIWVRCDAESMFDYLSYRGAARDQWKLSNWDEYLTTIDPDFRPNIPHYLVDNRLNAATTLIEQADRVAKAVRHVG